jgi:hypothetical protein
VPFYLVVESAFAGRCRGFGFKRRYIDAAGREGGADQFVFGAGLFQAELLLGGLGAEFLDLADQLFLCAGLMHVWPPAFPIRVV